MIPLDLYKNKRIGIVGGNGKTGMSIADSMVGGGADYVVSFDDSDFAVASDANEVSIESIIGQWKTLDVVVVSPGIPLLWPKPHRLIAMAHQCGIPVVNDVDLFQAHFRLWTPSRKMIAITGTNGKSTTTSLIGHILSSVHKKTAIGGNVGNPILSLDADQDYYVIELSSYQLECCNRLGFDTSILLNITPDHLVRHGGMHGYAATKQKIFANNHASALAIVGVDDEYCSDIYRFLKSTSHPNVVPVSGVIVPESGIGWSRDQLVDNRNCDNSGIVICDKYPLLDGAHNRQNIAAAFAACSGNGVAVRDFVDGLFSFSGLAHRQELVADIGGIQYINDSKATNAYSTEQALLCFDNIFWILGGRPKEDGIESLVKYFHKIRMAFLIGEVADEWCSLLKYHGVRSEISYTLEAAVASAHHYAVAFDGGVVLMSPSCASFDQFKNFEERGDKFREYVNKILFRN